MRDFNITILLYIRLWHGKNRFVHLSVISRTTYAVGISIHVPRQFSLKNWHMFEQIKLLSEIFPHKHLHTNWYSDHSWRACRIAWSLNYYLISDSQRSGFYHYQTQRIKISALKLKLAEASLSITSACNLAWPMFLLSCLWSYVQLLLVKKKKHFLILPIHKAFN